MKTQKALKYQLILTTKGLAIFFLFYAIAMAGVFILTAVENAAVQPGEMISAGDGSAMVYMLVMGIAAYRETLRFMIQNGISRKVTIRASIATGIISAAIISVVNTLLNVLFSSIQGAVAFRSMSELIYANVVGTTWSGIVTGMVFIFLGCIAFYSLGLFITLGYYHLSRRGKFIVSIGVPMILAILLPAIDNFLLNRAILKAFLNLFAWIGKSPVNLFIVYAVLTAACLFFAVMLNRRVNISNGTAK